MTDIPKSTKECYEWFINSYPESWNQTTLDFFYLFLGVLFRHSRKERTQEWLEKNLAKDCPQLSKKGIKQYGDIYRYIRDFKKFPKSQTAKLIAQSIHEDNIKKAKRRYRK
ncbi:MAG: hypothetical protein WAW33_00345 [Minisyncoccia bacterium]